MKYRSRSDGARGARGPGAQRTVVMSWFEARQDCEHEGRRNLEPGEDDEHEVRGKVAGWFAKCAWKL